MDEVLERIRPETHALESFIQATVHKLQSADDAGNGNGLLFLGNWHDAIPRLIFQDPVLQPVDTRIWGVIKIAAASGPTAFPTYKQIARQANVASDATVARSMAILRATRWLTLCRRVRDTQGKFRGNVYALHDEPLPLADALYLDQGYMHFLDQAHAHGHPQVRKVAAAVLATISEDLKEHCNVTGSEYPMQRRLDAINAIESEGHRFFAFSSRQLQELKSASGIPSPQNLKCEPLQKLKSDSSSSYINIKTTTTTEDTDIPPARAREVSAIESLALPPSLSPNERHLTQLCLRNAPIASHQDILDELAGRLRNAQRKHRSISNPIGYLARLCKAARTGEFTLTSLGLKAREERSRGSAVAMPSSDMNRDRALTDRRAALGSVDNRTVVPRTDRAQRPADGTAIKPSPFPQASVGPDDTADIDGTAIKPVPRAAMHPSDMSRHRALSEMRAALGTVGNPNVVQRVDPTQQPADGSAIATFDHRPDAIAINTSPFPQSPPGQDGADCVDGRAINPTPEAEHRFESAPDPRRDGTAIRAGTGPPADTEPSV